MLERCYSKTYLLKISIYYNLIWSDITIETNQRGKTHFVWSKTCEVKKKCEEYSTIKLQISYITDIKKKSNIRLKLMLINMP